MSTVAPHDLGTKQRAYVPALDLLRAAAILLITQSHLDALLPDSRIAAGGALGNALFFFISGYGLALGVSGSTPLWPWLARRALRLYVPLWTVIALVALLMPWRFEHHGLNLAQTWLWPTWYWFVSAIALFYLPYFWLARSTNRHALLAAAVLLLPLYVHLYTTALDLSVDSLEGGRFKWIFYAQVMLLGGWWARHGPARWPRATLWLLGALVYFIGFKLLARPLGLLDWQWTLHAAVALFAIAAHHVALDWAPRLQRSIAGPCIAGLAAIAYEIYLVQELLHHHPALTELPTPWGYVAFWPLCIAAAWGVARLHRAISALAQRTWARLRAHRGDGQEPA